MRSLTTPLTQSERRRYSRTFDRVLSALNDDWYAVYDLHRNEFMGLVDESLDEAVESLRDMGFESSTLAALKGHPSMDDRWDDGSYRLVDPDAPRWQYHVHLFDVADGVEVYCHREYRPDPRPVASESLRATIARLREHYKPKWDTSVPDEEATYFLGHAPQRLLEYLADQSA